MITTTIVRTNSDNSDFQKLVALLDQDLRIRDGEEHAFYAQFNKIDSLQHVVVAYKHDAPVGCGAIKPFSDHAMEVKRMFVLPDYRGQGIAGEMLQALEEWASELSFSACVLETKDHIVSFYWR